jgi:hypothetical protein
VAPQRWRISQYQRTHAPLRVRILHSDSRFEWGVAAHESGGSMHRSKILSGMFALMPAVLLATGYSSFGAAQADDCRIKPDGSAAAGLHWYYRVDRTTNRHCWYLHAQGLPVHAMVNATSRDRDIQNDTADDSVSKMPAAIVTPGPIGVRTETAERPTDFRSNSKSDFTSRWVDLPKSVDLNAHEVTASNGYAAEPAVANIQEQLAPAWPNLSTVSGDPRQDSPAGLSFGSISLAGAAVLALLLISEALVRVVRRSGWTLLQRQLRAASRPCTDDVELAIDTATPRPSIDWSEPIEAMSAAQSGAGELRRVLHRASSGLKPPQSFAPPGAMQYQDHSGTVQTHSALQRLKSRSFSGITWAPL